jgi:hypothetical protein
MDGTWGEAEKAHADDLAVRDERNSKLEDALGRLQEPLLDALVGETTS